MKSILMFTILFLFALVPKSNGQTSNENSETNNSIKMKEFSLLVRVPTTYTPEQAKAVNPKWSSLLDKWKADSIYITSFAFPGESYVVSGSEKVIKKESIISDNLRVVSNLFIRAVSIEAAVELSKLIPILEFGGSVEVREIPQRPTTSKQ
jgi:hypothetical protein